MSLCEALYIRLCDKRNRKNRANEKIKGAMSQSLDVRSIVKTHADVRDLLGLYFGPMQRVLFANRRSLHATFSSDGGSSEESIPGPKKQDIVEN